MEWLVLATSIEKAGAELLRDRRQVKRVKEVNR